MENAGGIGFLIGLCMLSSGCLPQRFVDTAEIPQNGGNTVYTLPSALRAVYARPGKDGKGLAICAEPAPDTVANLAMGMSAKAIQDIAGKREGDGVLDAATVKADTALEANLSVQMVELAGRTQVVLLAREMFYRLCEAQANGAVSDQEAFMQAWSEATKTIRVIATAEARKADAKLVNAAAKLEEARKTTASVSKRVDACYAKRLECRASKKKEHAPIPAPSGKESDKARKKRDALNEAKKKQLAEAYAECTKQKDDCVLGKKKDEDKKKDK